jgi:hypothetical protein
LQLVPPSKHNILDKTAHNSRIHPRRSLQPRDARRRRKPRIVHARNAVHQIANPQGVHRGTRSSNQQLPRGSTPLKWFFSK